MWTSANSTILWPQTPPPAPMAARNGGGGGAAADETAEAPWLRLSSSHVLTIHIEHCVAPRPSRLGTVRGSAERYERLCTAVRDAVCSLDFVSAAASVELE
eukprot:1214754-Pleurochrysis_carterae.AAC.1